MAAGFDNRQGARASFAFEPAKASTQQPASQGGFRGPQVQGGDTSIAGGIAAASQIRTFQPEAARIGGFLNEILAPAMERRKEEQFVAGMVAQMGAVAGEEIRVNDKNPINKIFGPSFYEEGAITYAAQDAVNTWQAKMMADKDKLRMLPPEELTKVVAASFDSMMTGDSFTDTAVKTSLIEASGPVIGALAKERYKWQQQTARSSFEKSVSSSATALQQVAVSLSETSDPTDAGNLAANAAFNNFRASLMMPTGMDEATYKSSLLGLYRKAAQDGNGYAVTAIKQTPGFADLLTDEEMVRLEDAELKYGKRAQSDAAVGMASRIADIHRRTVFGTITASEAMSEYATINEELKAKTGFDIDLYDYNDIVGAGNTVFTAMAAEARRQEDRAMQLEDMARKEAFELQKDELEAQRESAQAQVAWGSGQVDVALAAGIGNENNYNILAQGDFVAGKWDTMVKAFTASQWVSPLVKSQAQAQIGASLGREYNKDFENGFRRFIDLNRQSPAAAMQYYGKMYGPLVNYNRMVSTQSVSPRQAFLKAFSNPGQYLATPKLTAEAGKAVDTWLADNRTETWGGKLGITRANLTTSGKNALRRVMGEELGIMMKNSDVGPEALIPNLYAGLKASGAFEDYGRLGWSNPTNTKPLWKMLGVMQDEGDEVVEGVIDRELKATGFKDGVRGDNFDIRRIVGSDGQVAVAVVPYDDDDGAGSAVVIPFSKFKKQADDLRSGRVARGRPRAQPTGLDPYRRIKDETVKQRLARISREKDQNFRAQAGARER